MHVAEQKKAIIESSLDYLAEHHIRELYTRLSYELTSYLPMEPLDFMIQRLNQFKQERLSNPQVTPMEMSNPQDRPRVVLVIGTNAAKNKDHASAQCTKKSMHHIDMNSIVQEEIESESPFELLRKEIKRVQSEALEERERANKEDVHAVERTEHIYDRKIEVKDVMLVVTGVVVQSIGSALELQRLGIEPREVHFVYDGEDSEENEIPDMWLPLTEYYRALGKLTEIKS